MIKNSSILIALNNQAIVSKIVSSLQPLELGFHILNDYKELMEIIKIKYFNVVIVDTTIHGNSDLTILKEIKSISPESEVIMFCPERNPDTLTKAMQMGAYALLDNSIHDDSDIMMIASKALENQHYKAQNARRLKQIQAYLQSTEEISATYDMKHVIRQISKRAMALTEADKAEASLIEDNQIVMRQYWDGAQWVETLPDDNQNSGANSLVAKKDPTNKSDNSIDSTLEPNGSSERSDREQSNQGPYLSVPIIDRNGQFMGMIQVWKDKTELTSEEADENKTLLEGLAGTSTISIENVRLHNETQTKSKRIVGSERKYRTLVESSPYLILITQNDKLTYVNKMCIDVLKFTLQEFYSFNIYDIVTLPYREVLRENLRKKLNGEDVPTYEITLLERNGTGVILEVNSVLTEYNGNPAVQLIAKDLTESKKADAEVLRLAAAMNSLHSAVTITDMNINIKYINPAHTDIFGYSLDELIGKSSSILYPFEDSSGVSDKINEAILMVGWDGERLGVRKDGNVFPVYERTSVVKDKDGNTVAVVSVLEDVTIRKRLEQSLRESEERYRTLVQTATSAIIAIDIDGKVTMFNPSAEELFGYSRGEMINKDISPLIPDKYRGVFKESASQYLDSVIPNLVSNMVEFTGCKKNGEEFPIEVSISSCKISGQKIFTAIVFDITERKYLQEQLIHSEKMAAVGQLISGVTHEVNNPLAVVIGYSELLLMNEEMDEEIRSNIKIIYDEALRSKKVIQDLLSFARKYGPERKLTSINEIIEKTLTLKEYDFKKHNIKLEQNLLPNLPLVIADPNQLQQVFLNLVINAEYAMAEHKKNNGSTLTIETTYEQPNVGSEPNIEGMVQITFSDNGPGIKKEVINKIFDPFFTTKPEGKGTGLGLSVSYGIIKQHEGELLVSNQDEGGAVFKIRLPIYKEDPVENKDSEKEDEK